MLNERDRAYAIKLFMNQPSTMDAPYEYVITLYKEAADTLGNLAHYFHGRPYEADDVVVVMRSLDYARNQVTK